MTRMRLEANITHAASRLWHRTPLRRHIPPMKRRSKARPPGGNHAAEKRDTSAPAARSPSQSDIDSDELLEAAERRARALENICGSRSADWNNILGIQILDALPRHHDFHTRSKQVNAAFAGLVGIDPKDELEGMVVAQLIAAHNATMECYRRAAVREQTFEERQENLNQANKLSRTWAMLLEALNRHRGKGQQKVTVEHVHVHSGGQAVVGVLESPGGGGGGLAKFENQPHAKQAKQIAHASQPAMQRLDEERKPLPIASNAKRPLPHARRVINGGTEG
jgi:hypothetical protein